MDSGQFQLRVFRVLVSEERVRLTFYLWGEIKFNSRKFYILSLINSLNNNSKEDFSCLVLDFWQVIFNS